jgi:hypothetical protein
VGGSQCCVEQGHRRGRERRYSLQYALEADLGDITAADSSVVMDLFLSYRALNGWAAMVDLARRMAPALAETVKVQEQLAMALNRNGQGDRAELVLQKLIRKQGPTNETFGILGRVCKERCT